MALFAQGVEIDTVIPLLSRLYNGFFIPELNKLYISAEYRIFVVDCSLYQVETIPFGWSGGGFFSSYNWRQRKLYISNESYMNGVVVIDVDVDTILRWIPERGIRGHCYVSANDRLYIGAETLKILDCAADTIIGEKEPPIAGYTFCHPFWDSVHNKLYVGMERFNPPFWMAVYDCSDDSLLACFMIPSRNPVWMQFHYDLGKGYYVNYLFDYPGVIDIKNDCFLKVFPFGVEYGGLNPLALDTIDNKVYCGMARPIYPDTIYVIDCLTDSIIKRLVEGGWGPLAVRWAPWSNRVYFTGGPKGETLKVLDCRTDSVIARVRLEEYGIYGPPDLQLDPIHHRVFAIGRDSTLYVLREVIPGVEEREALPTFHLTPIATVVRGILFLPASGGEHPASSLLLDITGKKVLDLKPGANDIRHLSPGVYFIRGGSGIEKTRFGERSRKVVITK